MNLEEYNKQRRRENNISIVVSLILFMTIGYVISILGERFLW